MTRHQQDAAEDSAAKTVNEDPQAVDAGDSAAADGAKSIREESPGSAESPVHGESGDTDRNAGMGDNKSAGDNADLPPAKELAEQLAEAREELSELKDSALRARAEMENVRRRTQNEVLSARKYAIEGFAQELLGVKDSLDQASLVELSGNESDAVVRMQEGLALTVKQLDTVLAKFSVNEVEAGPGVKFNPDQHQAISMVPSEEVESNHIISVMQKGFTLKDRLLRPAMVVVAS